MNQEMKAALEAAMANPRLSKKMEEIIVASDVPAAQADVVAELPSNAVLVDVISTLNEVIAALKAAGLMKS